MSLARRLWAEHGELADRARHHPFVQHIADGTLDRPRFASYVGQDAAFLQAFARAYALAMVAAPDARSVLAFADLVTGVRDELRLHESYARQWGIDAWAVDPRPATLAYTDFLLATAATRGLGPLCAAMTPCMRLYAHLGRTLADEVPAATAADNPYRSWVAAYADPEFAALAERLEELLDTFADDEAAAREVYGRAMRLEIAFFDAAFAGDARSG